MKKLIQKIKDTFSIFSSSKGFTLLELLVVVLIIGILAGIALPQYNRVKEKAEASQLLISVKALHEAQQRYYLANGVFAENFDDLDINLSGYERGGCEFLSEFGTKTDCFSDEKNSVHLTEKGDILALRKIGRYQKSGFTFRGEDVSLPINKLICYEYNQNGFCSDLLNCTLRKTSGVNGYYFCDF